MIGTVYLSKLLVAAAIQIWIVSDSFFPLCEARGGGSKRTFGSPKSQGSQNQNLEADCGDQTSCLTDSPDPSLKSTFGATMALVGPLLVLLTFIAVIKYCIPKAYPRGYYQNNLSQSPPPTIEDIEGEMEGGKNEGRSINNKRHSICGRALKEKDLAVVIEEETEA